MPQTPQAVGSVEVFCSYSHKDEQHRKDFEAHASMLRRENLIQIWQDRKIVGGEDWAGEIDSHLNSADIITLFVSSDFLNSDYCYEKEMRRALERHASNEARVVPIIVRPCDWQSAPFKSLQAVPLNGKPVTLWENRDEAWTSVTNCLRLTVEVVIEKVQSELRDQARRALPVEESVCFIFAVDDPEKIEEQKQKAYAWARQQRADRAATLHEIQHKIEAIQQKVFGEAGQSERQAYEHWYEYLKNG